MFRRLGALGLMAAGVFTIACSDSRDDTPTAPQPLLTGLPCKPSDVTKLAKDLLGPSSAGAGFAQQLTSNQTTNIPILFNLFAEVAALANAATLTETQLTLAANLTIQGFACGDLTLTDLTYTGGTDDVTKFKNALGPTGAYEVRGRPGQASDNVESHNVDIGETGASGIHSEDFAAWQGGAALFYGFSRGGLGKEAPAIGSVVAFEWFTARPRASVLDENKPAQVAFCVNFDPTEFNSGQFRVERENTILPFVEFPLCPVNFTSMGFKRREPRSSLATALAWLGRTLWSPEPLEATSFFFTTSPGGSARKLSPHELINPNGLTVTFEHQPTNGVKNAPIAGTPGPDVQVKVVGARGTPWAGVHIKISALANNSVLISPDPLCNEADTDENGIAHFPKLALQKPGGVTFLASTTPGLDADVNQFDFASVESNKVNIKNSTLKEGPSCTP